MMAASREDRGANVAGSWEALRDEAMGCTRCPLYKHATQTVFGEGPLDARLMFVGEQPGDQEDQTGKPFVGPAGRIFDEALEKAGIDRARVYVTNAVKHFKYEQRGKRRIHSKPNAGEIQACRWWYGQERELIRPPITVALGATAARQMLGKAVTITGARGHAHPLEDGGEGWVTIHPSFLLRIREHDETATEFRRFVEDLKQVRARIETLR
jgi:uracil-DNA glycosylase family protein